MTQIFQSYVSNLRSANELRVQLTELLHHIAFGAADAHISSIHIEQAPRLTWCGHEPLCFHVTYSIEKPKQISFTSHLADSEDPIARLIAREFSRFASHELETLQASRSQAAATWNAESSP